MDNYFADADIRNRITTQQLRTKVAKLTFIMLLAIMQYPQLAYTEEESHTIFIGNIGTNNTQGLELELGAGIGVNAWDSQTGVSLSYSMGQYGTAQKLGFVHMIGSGHHGYTILRLNITNIKMNDDHRGQKEGSELSGLELNFGGMLMLLKIGQMRNIDTDEGITFLGFALGL